ncbi:hypothetical protein TWF694_009252 [Orbilia ellipsospora]|uniref:Uncharacterized protein n=1 Tax=Orbilia ellipsospora TaxID=2528407 RepID=A0AAV9XEC6_9PEZI
MTFLLGIYYTAIRASAFPTRPGTADCSSFFLSTLYTTDTETIHTTSTATVTATVTITVGLPATPADGKKKKRRIIKNRQELQKRQAVIGPSKIPAYASPCSGAVRYSSACSCIGMKAMTVTLPDPSTTVTTTMTDSIATVTTPTSTLTATSLLLQFTDNTSTYSNAYVASSTLAGTALVVPSANPSSAAHVVIQPDGSITANGNLLVGQSSSISTQARFLVWIPPTSPLPSIYAPLNCSLDGSYNLSCNCTGFTVFGTYKFAPQQDTLRIFSSGFTFDPTVYIAPLHLRGIS